MRYLVLTIGSPASGKSTWIDNYGLRPYTIEPDNIRVMLQSPETKVDGTEGITQKNDGEVWNLVYDILEKRMKRGELVVIDATHMNSKFLNKYKSYASKYRYRVIGIDFTDIDVDTVLERNRKRAEKDPYKFVPEEVIKNFAERAKTFRAPSWVNVIKHDDEKSLNDLFDISMNFDKYSKLHFIGDIHGCADEFIQLLGKIKVKVEINEELIEVNLDENDFYVFLGDYLDRAPTDNDLILTYKILKELQKFKNVLMITGNHEFNAVDNVKSFIEIQKEMKNLPSKIEEQDLKVLKLKNHANTVAYEFMIEEEYEDYFASFLEAYFGILDLESAASVTEFKKFRYENFDKDKAIEVIENKMLLGSNEEIQKAKELILGNPDFEDSDVGELLRIYIKGVKRASVDYIKAREILKKMKNRVQELQDYYNDNFRKIIPKDTRRTLHILIDNFPESDVKEFFKKFGQIFYGKFGDKTLVGVHGGFPKVPTIKTPIKELIYGAGTYGDEFQITEAWFKNTPDNHWMIFGHRDIHRELFNNQEVTDNRCCVLNGDAESGQPNSGLKAVTFSKENRVPEFHFVESQREINEEYQSWEHKRIEKALEKNKEILENEGIIAVAKNHRGIEVKEVLDAPTGKVYAINFTRKIFKTGKYDELSIHARGLFVQKNEE